MKRLAACGGIVRAQRIFALDQTAGGSPREKDTIFLGAYLRRIDHAVARAGKFISPIIPDVRTEGVVGKLSSQPSIERMKFLQFS